MIKIKNPEVLKIFNTYPSRMRKKLLYLRQLILETASEIESVGAIEETLKWGEPSYIATRGSTIRVAWKKSRPDEYAMYFHCKTRLVDTYKELYRDSFKFMGSRAIVLHCLSLIIKSNTCRCWAYE